MPFFPQRSLTTQVRAALASLVLLMSLGSLGLLLLARRATSQATDVYRERLQPMARLVEVSEAYAVDLTTVLRGVRGGRMEPGEGLRRLRESRARARDAWRDYTARRERSLLIAEADAGLSRLEALCARLEDLLPTGVSRELGHFGDAEWLPEVVATVRVLQQLREAEDRQASATIHLLEASSRRTTVLGLALMAVSGLLALWLARGLAAGLRSGVDTLLDRLHRVAEGDLEPAPVSADTGEFATAERELDRTVSRLRQVLEDLRAQQALEQAILDGAQAGIIGLDLDGRVNRWNRAMELMTGYRTEEVLGVATPDLWRVPEELEALRAQVSAKLGRPLANGVEALQAAANLPGFTTECHYRAKDGTLVPVLLTISKVLDPDGELHGTMGVALDLRDLERLRVALQESEARYRRLAERLPAVVYQMQMWPDGRRAWPFLSPQIRELFGVDPETWAANPDYPYARMHPEDRAEYLRRHAEATWEMAPLNWEGRTFTERPGEMKWIRARSNPTRQPDGSILWDGLMEDITELKRAEESIRQSESRAHEASRAKSAFLASMSHELRTPLSAILGYSRLMARDPLRSEEDQVQLEHILRAGEHLLSLINDVLSLSKIEAGRMELKRLPFDPAALVAELEALFRLTALSKGIGFRVETRGLPPQVEGDPAKLRQVLVNLLGNALKFTHHGEVRLEVEWTAGVMAVAVEDTGPGIPESELPGLFGAFNQASLGYAIGGTGLGLHISQALVTLMGGGIGVSSTVGVGSRFYFDLPLPEPEVLAVLGDRGRVLRLSGGQDPAHILVVDDRLENRDILDRLLRQVGFRCSLAEHGQAALDQWRDGRPDLVLMDLRMPVMDGFEATGKLRALEAEAGWPRTPVVAISASVYDVNREDLEAIGFDAFLTKPIHEDHLFQTLEDLTGLRFDRAEAPGASAEGDSLAGLTAQDPAWRGRLLEDVSIGDLDSAEALLAELSDPILATAVRRRLRSYNLEEILQHLR